MFLAFLTNSSSLPIFNKVEGKHWSSYHLWFLSNLATLHQIGTPFFPTNKTEGEAMIVSLSGAGWIDGGGLRLAKLCFLPRCLLKYEICWLSLSPYLFRFYWHYGKSRAMWDWDSVSAVHQLLTGAVCVVTWCLSCFFKLNMPKTILQNQLECRKFWTRPNKLNIIPFVWLER